MPVVSLSLTPETLADAQARARRLGYRSFSAYCEHVLQVDVAGGSHHVLQDFDNPLPAPPAVPVSYKISPSTRKANRSNAKK